MATKAINMSSQTLQPDSPSGGQFDRIGVVAVDADASNIPLFICQGMSVATVTAVCDTAAAAITVRLIYFNGSNLPCGSSMAITFMSGATADFGSLFMGVPDSDFWRPVAGASLIGVKVDAISAGRWSIHGSVG
jgi:hypothetical protein